ncbi:hypothetical protein BgiBS90_001207 [Biomphalaria glabrata]|nr:hypothetical protein BgiBS90_001207 [Biomphalaria glabrata]
MLFIEFRCKTATAGTKQRRKRDSSGSRVIKIALGCPGVQQPDITVPEHQIWMQCEHRNSNSAKRGTSAMEQTFFDEAKREKLEMS